MNILITGSTGFVGSFIVEYALKENVNVVGTIRKTSSLQYLQDERINFIEIDFRSIESIQKCLGEFQSRFGNIDYVIHNAGITKTTKPSDYNLVNYQYTVNLIKALEASSHQLKKFTYISSMAASAPGNEISGEPISIDDLDEPVSAYGWSKKNTEVFLEEECNIPYLILRPPPVFGPRDKDMLDVFKIVNKNLEIYIGGKRQLLSFIYVKDLARAIVKSTLSSLSSKKYFLSDNGQYDNMLFHRMIKQQLNKKTLTIHLPLFILYVVAFFSEVYTKITGNFSQLNLEKIKELKCTNWMCDSNDFYRDLQLKPVYSLEEGIKETIEWYQEKNWL